MGTILSWQNNISRGGVMGCGWREERRGGERIAEERGGRRAVEGVVVPSWQPIVCIADQGVLFSIFPML
jgi:hypothetical protein